MLKFFRKKAKNQSPEPASQEERASTALPQDDQASDGVSIEPQANADEHQLEATPPHSSAQEESTTALEQVLPEESTTPETIIEEPNQVPKPKLGLFKRLKQSLSKTRQSLTKGMADLFLGKKSIDDDLFEELETLLLIADVGVEATQRIIEQVTEQVARKALKEPQKLYEALKQALLDILAPCEKPLAISNDQKPFMILMVGVNGAGKTTTIGKMANQFKAQGQSVMLAAGDTFRAAAVEQLTVWGERNQVPVIAQQTGADSASVIFDALQSATAKGTDILIADTAGRLHTRDNLMEELLKITRVAKKISPQAPHEILLVLDASMGQNALQQARVFHKMINLSGIAITKLDGTAKGGIIFAIANELGLPIRYIGVGEAIEDLRPFDANEFVEALLSS